MTVWTAPAQADVTQPRPKPRASKLDRAQQAQPEPDTKWISYRPAVAVAYGLSLGITATSIVAMYAAQDGRLLGIAYYGVFASTFTPPIAHWVNGNLGGGFVSLGGTLAFGLVGGVVGAAIGEGTCEDTDEETNGGCMGGAVIGAVVGAAVGQGLWGVIDVGILAQRRVRVEPSTVRLSIESGMHGRPWMLTLAAQY